MLFCIIKGAVVLGLNFAVVKLYPMSLHDTLMNALLFNVTLFLAGSLAVIHLCSVSFADYARFTSILSIFVVQVRDARGNGEARRGRAVPDACLSCFLAGCTCRSRNFAACRSFSASTSGPCWW